MKTPFRSVPDTNVVLASHLNPSEDSPNVEYFERWVNGEFALLYSRDTVIEYIRKLREQGVSRAEVKTFVRSLFTGELIFIEYYHFKPDQYPIDRKDIGWCKINCVNF